jgi:VanZ family protein
MSGGRALYDAPPVLKLLSRWLPVILWTMLILSAANDRFSDEQTAGWLERTFGMTLPRVVNVVMRKSGHVLAYAILALLARRAQGSFRIALAIAFAVSVTDETMQAMTATREGSPFDVLLDTCAAALALAVGAKGRSSLTGSQSHRGSGSGPHPL